MALQKAGMVACCYPHIELVATAPGGVAKLRELILTLAVQGKLVAQDPADEPASELLKKIRAEKDRLVAEGKIKRDKPLAAISEEEKPFALPQGWEWVVGRDLFSIVRGVTYQKTDAKDAPTENHLPILRANNIRGSVNLDDLVYVPASLISEDQFLRSGDYVVCLASGSKNLVGKAAPFREMLNCSFAFCGDSQARIVDVPGLASDELMRLCDALEAQPAGPCACARQRQLEAATRPTAQHPAGHADRQHHARGTGRQLATRRRHFDWLLDRPEAVDALEQTILQLAVRGLLVPQDLPANWKKIRAETA
jgi:type I restriction enzyme, S subunit